MLLFSSLRQWSRYNVVVFAHFVTGTHLFASSYQVKRNSSDCRLELLIKKTIVHFSYRENGGKGIRAAIVSVVATGSGQQQQKLEQQQQQQQQHTSSNSSDGSASASVVATSAAMWSAISNPLLLINHVMRRSMDFQEGNSSNDVVAATDASIPPSCIVSVERHAEPRTNPHVNLGDTDESTRYTPSTIPQSSSLHVHEKTYYFSNEKVALLGAPDSL